MFKKYYVVHFIQTKEWLKSTWISVHKYAVDVEFNELLTSEGKFYDFKVKFSNLLLMKDLAQFSNILYKDFHRVK